MKRIFTIVWLPLPERIDSKGDFNRDFNNLAVGSGPYALVRHDSGKEIVIERREDCRREKPHIQTVVSRSLQIMEPHGTL